MKRPRLFVFPDRQDFLLCYIPVGVPFEMPRITAPLTKQILSEAFAPHALPYAITETTAGRYSHAMKLAKDAEAAEAGQKAREQQAVQAKILTASNDPLEAQRAKAILDKGVCDDEIRDLRKKIGNAKSKAFKRGEYMDPDDFRRLEQRLAKKQEESIAYQAFLGRLRDAIKRRNRAEHAAATALFKKVAYEMLAPEVFEEICARADEMLVEQLDADDDLDESTGVKRLDDALPSAKKVTK